MRKFSLVLSAVAVTGLTVAAQAGESNYWLDVRDGTSVGASITTPAAPYTIGQGEAAALNDVGVLIAGGGRGNGQILRISPTISSGLHIGTASPNFPYWPNYDTADAGGDRNASNANLWLYCDVNPNTDAPAGTGDVISSIGLDIAVATGAAANRYDISTVNWSWTYVDNGGNANFGTANGVSSRTGVVGAKYVKVPVSGASTYATAGGLVPGGPYQLGKLRMQADARGIGGCVFGAGQTTASTYNVTMSINNLLITRTFSSGGNATPEERVSLGYTGGAVEADVSGNTVGGAGARDAVVAVRMLGDFTGDGRATTADAAAFLAAQPLGATISQLQRYCFDMNGSGTVTTADYAKYLQWQSAPCP